MDSTDLSWEQMNDHLANPGNFDAAAAVAIMRSISRRCRSCPAIVFVLLSLPPFPFNPPALADFRIGTEVFPDSTRSIVFGHDGHRRRVSPHENVRDAILAQVVSIAQSIELGAVSPSGTTPH